MERSLGRNEESVSEASVRDFDAFAAQYREDLVRLCRSRLGDLQSAEDATQETLIAAFRAFRRFDERYPRAWLMRIAINKCHDELRRRRPWGSAGRPLSLTETGAEPEGDAAPQQDPVWEHIERGETWKEFGLAMQGLQPIQRRTLHLVFARGLSYEETARLTNCPEGTVKSRINRARHALRREIRSA